MKVILYLSVILIGVAMQSCGTKDFGPPTATFSSPFPKRNVKLANILGAELKILSEGDTLHLAIFSNKEFNLITDIESFDTLFQGRVSRFRESFYFTTQVNDSSYWIHAVKISGNLIYGIRDGWFQMYAVDNYVMNGHCPKIVEYIKPDTSAIRLKSDKRELRKMFNEILGTESPDTILYYNRSLSACVERVELSNAQMGEFTDSLRAFPNPASTYIDLEVRQPGYSSFVLTDLNGSIRISGSLQGNHTRIDLGGEKPGLYVLSIIGSKSLDQLKIVKQ